MGKWKIVANVAAVALLGGALGYYNFVDKAAESGAKKGNRCPDFTAQIYKVEGNTFSVSEETFTLSQQIGKVCVVNFWETWCQGCVEELPEFNEICKEYAGRVEVIAIVGTTSTPDEAAEWLSDKGWKDYTPDEEWTQYALPFGYLPTQTCTLLGVRAMLPRTVVVDKSGIIAYEGNTTMSYAAMQDIIEDLL